MTAYHCIASGGQPKVELRDGSSAVGRVLYARPQDDLAVLQVALDTVPAQLAESTPDPGGVVDVVGHPLGAQLPAGYLTGLLRFSQSRGVISAVGPVALQTTAPVNPGNSGGPVFGENGEVVGIVSRRLKGDGLGFATRVEGVQALLDDQKGPSVLGGTAGFQVQASSWSGRSGTVAVGALGYASFRDRVVVSGAAAIPLSPRWDAVRFGRISWVRSEARLGLRQRLFRGRATTMIDVYGGVGDVAATEGDRDTFRRMTTSAAAPLAGLSIGFGPVVLDGAWVFAQDEEGAGSSVPGAIRGQMRFTWPGRLWIF